MDTTSDRMRREKQSTMAEIDESGEDGDGTRKVQPRTALPGEIAMGGGDRTNGTEKDVDRGKTEESAGLKLEEGAQATVVELRAQASLVCSFRASTRSSPHVFFIVVTMSWCGKIILQTRYCRGGQ